MSELLEFKTEQGDSVLVEVEELSRGPVTRGGRGAEAVVEAGESLEQVLARLGPAVKGIVSQLRASADWPDELEVEFGVKLSADSNVIIARAGGEDGLAFGRQPWTVNHRLCWPRSSSSSRVVIASAVRVRATAVPGPDGALGDGWLAWDAWP